MRTPHLCSTMGQRLVKQMNCCIVAPPNTCLSVCRYPDADTLNKITNWVTFSPINLLKGDKHPSITVSQSRKTLWARTGFSNRIIRERSENNLIDSSIRTSWRCFFFTREGSTVKWGAHHRLRGRPPSRSYFVHFWTCAGARNDSSFCPFVKTSELNYRDAE